MAEYEQAADVTIVSGKGQVVIPQSVNWTNSAVNDDMVQSLMFQLDLYQPISAFYSEL